MGSDDQEMVTRFLRGEKDAVGTVDGWISRAAWPYQRRLADRWDDALQEVRLEVTRLLGQGKFRGESSLRTYLWRVVSHTCLDLLRPQKKWSWTNIEEVPEPEAAPAGAARQEDKDLVLRVLEQVPADCREMWRMIVAGLSYREMSLRLSVAEGTLRVRVLRCRERAVAARRELMAGPRGNGRNNEVKNSPKRSERANTDDM
jgi:RNA polymerase sigma-70 factor, ECF subfamily